MKKRKLFAILMSLALVFTYMPAMAFAADGDASSAPEQVYDYEGYGVELEGYGDTDEYNYTWMLNGQTLTENGPAIYSADETGLYTCIVSDESGTVIHQKDFDVHVADSISFTSVDNKQVWDVDNPIVDGDAITVHFSADDTESFVFSDGRWMCGTKELPLDVVAYTPEWPDEYGDIFTYRISCGSFDELEDTAEYVSNIASITFMPTQNVTAWGPDIYGDSYDGNDQLIGSGYILESMFKHTMNGNVCWSSFNVGDKVIVNYRDGRTVEYINKDFEYTNEDGRTYTYDTFADANGNDIWVSYVYKVGSLVAGNNQVTLEVEDARTLVNVFIDTPELKQQRDAAAAQEQERIIEAGRQGTPDPSIPKVKAKKPSTAKKGKITTKWTKLNKKKLKKSGVTRYEIWVSTDPSFPRGMTIEKTTKKTKSSLKISGLMKNTKYYVRVRGIKYVNGVKYVGPWSQKTVKTKKK